MSTLEFSLNQIYNQPKHVNEILEIGQASETLVLKSVSLITGFIELMLIHMNVSFSYDTLSRDTFYMTHSYECVAFTHQFVWLLLLHFSGALVPRHLIFLRVGLAYAAWG